MRSLLAAILSVFLPARGKRRAAPMTTAPATAPRPASPSRAAEHLAPLDGDAVAMVRPYYAAYEREQERRRQRERRRAAVLATMGQDYAGATA